MNLMEGLVLSRYRIVVTSQAALQTADVFEDFRHTSQHEVVVAIPEKRTEEVMIQLLENADAVIAGSDPLSRSVLENCPRLKVISRPGVGYDAIDIKAARELGVRVATTPGTNERAVADHAFALILGLARALLRLDRETRQGSWKRPVSADVGRKVLGIIGLGAIGRQVALRGRGFDMQVLAHEIYPNLEFVKQHGVELTTLEDLLQRADFVSLHTPSTPDTYHLMNEERLRLMKPTAYLVNTARGPLIDEKALLKALKEGWIAGAGLDVFEKEPPGASPFFDLDNVLVSPHIAGITDDACHAMAEMAIENVVRVLDGNDPVYEVLE